MRMSDFKVLSFDCYGTLIDWESGILAAAGNLLSLGNVPGRLLEAHARYEALHEAANPTVRYPQILSRVYESVAKEWGLVVTRDECEAFGLSVPDWPAFPDSPSALAYLKEHFKLAILSNVDRASFRSSAARLEVEFDYVFTAEDIGSYKPDQRNFDYMVAKLGQGGYAKGDILHVAESLFHDHAPSNRIGLSSAWIHRRHAQGGFGATQPPETMPSYNFRFTSMEELAQAHRDESK